jgi:hypothetical protein
MYGTLRYGNGNGNGTIEYSTYVDVPRMSSLACLFSLRYTLRTVELQRLLFCFRLFRERFGVAGSCGMHGRLEDAYIWESEVGRRILNVPIDDRRVTTVVESIATFFEFDVIHVRIHPSIHRIHPSSIHPSIHRSERTSLCIITSETEGAWGAII